MNKKTIWLILGLGVIGAVGAGAVMSSRRKKSARDKAQDNLETVKPDTQPGMITCPDCGNKFKEYEFFCPSCKRPNEEPSERK